MLPLILVASLFTVAAADPPPRGYAIPTLDLADEKHRQIIVDRETGQSLGHPTTALLADGKTILCVYPQGHGRGAIVYKRSTDGGLTWSTRLPTPTNWASSQEVPTQHWTPNQSPYIVCVRLKVEELAARASLADRADP